MSDENSLNRNGTDITVDTAVRTGRDLAGDEERKLLADFFDEIIIKGDKRNVFRCGKIHDGSRRVSGDPETGINLIVLKTAGGSAVIQEIDPHILIAKSHNLKNRANVPFNTRSGSPHAHAFALEVGNGFDAGSLRCHQLNMFRVESSNRPNVFHRSFEHHLSVKSPEGNIILNHGNLYIPLCQQVNVGNGGITGFGRSLNIRPL